MVPIGSHPSLHPLFETLGYLAGYAVFRQVRSRNGDIIAEPQRWVIIAAAACGAFIGSRTLGLAEQWPTVVNASRFHHWWLLLVSPGGKTIVGGLLGGWMAVEIVKKLAGIQNRTGDLFVLPLCVGIAIGRIGCFLAGLADDTYGTQTTLPWGVDFGDGVPRHPTQIYEIVFLIGIALLIRDVRLQTEGMRFRILLALYLGWRLIIDFLKPQPLILNLNVIQWACFAGLIVLALDFVRTLRLSEPTVPDHRPALTYTQIRSHKSTT